MHALREFWFQFSRHRGAVVGIIIFLIIMVMAATADLVLDHGPLDLMGKPFIHPAENSKYLLGTDNLGRDVLAGIFFGARVSLLIAVIATFIATSVGVAIGALSGYHGGWLDDGLMRFTEIFQTIPPFMLMIVIVAIFQPSIKIIVIAIGATAWPEIARLVRGEFVSLREREFVQAAKGVGMSDIRIICTQVLPNAIAPVIVMGSFIVARSILNESGLAFLGLGDPNVMSWGAMIGKGREVLRIAEYLTVIPGIAILVTVLALNLVGDGLNDALNPRQKER
jgi:peptide/nickel transport system permease protein